MKYSLFYGNYADEYYLVEYCMLNNDLTLITVVNRNFKDDISSPIFS